MNARSSRRYALRVPVELQTSSRNGSEGLLIELTLETARISQLGDVSYTPGDSVTVKTGCGRSLPGRIRWAHDGIAGVQFDNALHLPELTDWVSTNRRELAAA